MAKKGSEAENKFLASKEDTLFFVLALVKRKERYLHHLSLSETETVFLSYAFCLI